MTRRWGGEVVGSVARRVPVPPVLRRARRSGGPQGGVSLIEVLIALALVGVIIVALATGFLVLVGTTTSTSERQKVQAALNNLSESLLTAEYLECPSGGTAADYDTMYRSWGPRWEPAGEAPGMSYEIVDVEYWDDSTDAFVDTCSEDLGVQRLTVSVEWRDRSDTAQVVKAQP